MNSVREIERLNKRELENCVPPSASWHTDYRDTAYVYVGGLSFDLTEGDIITIFSQFGEPVWLKLARDKETGKSKGYAFLKYEDQRSTDLAVDNLGGATILGRILRVDHTRYKKRDDENDEEFDVTVRVHDQEAESKEKGRLRHHSRHRKHEDHRDKDERKACSTRNSKEIENDLDDEDPMKDYIAREREARRSKRDKRRRSRERRHRGHHD